MLVSKCVELIKISDKSDGVRIAVADQGPGLSQEDQARIFERFYRADSSRVRIDGEGSGLGLSIVDAVMQAHLSMEWFWETHQNRACNLKLI